MRRMTLIPIVTSGRRGNVRVASKKIHKLEIIGYMPLFMAMEFAFTRNRENKIFISCDSFLGIRIELRSEFDDLSKNILDDS